jgi:curli biogenesis system outer membrane secretion channel CsgG
MIKTIGGEMRKKIVLLTLIIFFSVVLLTYASEKPRLGVLRFTNSVAGNSFWAWNPKVARNLQDMLISELASTHAFQVLERKEIGAVLTEQDLSASGRVSKSTLVKMGKIKGAKYLIAGTVSAFEMSQSTGGKVRFKGISLGGKKTKVYIAVDVKVIDTETGEIVDTRTIEAKAKGTKIGAGLSLRNFDIGGSQAKKTPVGKAIRACIVYISEYLKCSLAKVHYPRCMKKWDKMEKKRREKTKNAIDLDM